MVPSTRYWKAATNALRRLSQGDEDVSGKRRDLQKDEQVERIARDGDAEQSRETQAVHRIEQILPLARQLGGDARTRVGHDDRADERYQHQHECAQPVDAVLDSPRGWPAADGVRDCAHLGGAHGQRDRHCQGDPTGRGGKQPREVLAAHQHDNRCTDEGEHHLERREVLEDHCRACSSSARSCSRISSSSMVP